MKKLIFKGFLFLTILALILASLSNIFIYKIDHRGKLLEGLYNSKDPYDVVLMGSSHMNGGIDPNVLWNKYGITSFNYATGGQPLDVTYYLLKEVLKKHTPSVVVVDLFYLGMETPYGDTGFISNALDNIKFSMNKVQAIQHCTPPEEWIPYLLPILKYHFRWSSLTAADFSYNSSSVYYLKGFSAGTQRYGKADVSYADTENKYEIPEKGLYYFYQFIELSKEKGFQLVFVNMPCDYTESNQTAGWVNDCEALFNTVSDLCRQENVPFLDLCDRMDEIGLDFAQDMNNAGHLNVWGAYKTSFYFGAYLKQNFTLPDRRNNEELAARWNEDYSHSLAAAVENGTVGT
ncbi:MAG: SGNH/GDSL hydrolase family protein [Oscillospiraceae bacterium]